MTLTAALLDPYLTGSGAARPLITYYDDATGERVELSATTTANWAAKAANLLRDECDVEPGTPVAVLLPAHWQAAAEPAGGGVALSLDAFGKGIPGLPAGVVDFAPEVRLHGDDFTPWDAVPGSAPALAGSTVAEVLADARGRAAALGIGEGDRALSTLDWSTVDGLIDGLLAVLAAGASLVQCRNADPATLERRATAEKVTVRLG